MSTPNRATDGENHLQISYRSEALLINPLRDLASIVKESKFRNSAYGITGVLLFDGTFFLQTFEGPPEKTKEVYAKIIQDRRHNEVKPFGIYEIEERDFPDWHMEFISFEETARIVPDMKNLEFSYRRLREIHAMSFHVARQREKRVSYH